MNDTLPYRPAAGIMLINDARRVFVGQRIDNMLEAWQMPQGGLDPGEDAATGALRELEEETGIPRTLVEIVAQAREDLHYDLPPEMLGKIWGGKYRGQRQSWFLMRFLGTDQDVVLDRFGEPEFRAWKWAEPEQLPHLIVPFKKALYERVIAEFASFLR